LLFIVARAVVAAERIQQGVIFSVTELFMKFLPEITLTAICIQVTTLLPRDRAVYESRGHFLAFRGSHFTGCKSNQNTSDRGVQELSNDIMGHHIR
jgi:hypothetical protein